MSPWTRRAKRGCRAAAASDDTLEGYRNDLKPARRRLGHKNLTQLTKADGDELVEWMLGNGRVNPRHYRADSLMSRVAGFILEHPHGVSAAEIRAEFPGEDVHTCLSGLLRASRITRPQRAFYVAIDPATLVPAEPGVKAVTVRSTLTRFRMVVQSYVDQGLLEPNVIALVERPGDEALDEDELETSKSWTPAEIERFREGLRHERLYACWLLSCYGLRRSEVLGLRWTRIDATLIRIRRGRVTVGTQTEENGPKSKRSRRDLPPPADVTAALRNLKRLQRTECLALGIPWSDDRLIAVHEDGTPVRPEWYSDEFHRLRRRLGLRRIHLKGLRNTSVTLMLARGIHPHIVAAWHGHDPAVSLTVYNDPQPEDLRAAGEVSPG
ncbi:tyrosine-type recombinase/integrase [Nocardia sp. NPDC051570]|uniref:tyrosine-type recombinase/integrase n=1 Tax=Nocardia sp. NPDC051570 TaxID=3364324 RepID=UPI0037918729